MTTQKTLLTADEFYRLYAHKDGRYELVDGEVVEMVPFAEGTVEHGGIALNIRAAISQLLFVRRSGMGSSSGRVGLSACSTGPDTVRGPDVSFVTASGSPR